MTIDKELISRLEHLARLELSAEERDRIQHDLNEILEMVEKLKELDTENVDPLIYITEEPIENRRDEINNQLARSEALRNAPDADQTYFKVPKVIDLAKEKN